jgi:hypothetical protein
MKLRGSRSFGGQAGHWEQLIRSTSLVRRLGGFAVTTELVTNVMTLRRYDVTTKMVINKFLLLIEIRRLGNRVARHYP